MITVMFRTRDLVLGLLAFGFVGLLFVATTSGGVQMQERTALLHYGEEVVTEGAVLPEDSPALDQLANRERLRALVAERGAASISAPESEPAADQTDEPVSDDVTAAVLSRCLLPDDTLAVVGRWPFREARFALREGARVVLVERAVDQQFTGTSTVPAVAETILLQLPLQPRALAAADCVPSEVVGVTVSGQLIFNQDLRPYVGYGPDDLIGYARDGYPIYGNYDGNVDQCGGYEHPTGYRYSLTDDRSFIIGCFKAEPQTINLD